MPRSAWRELLPLFINQGDARAAAGLQSPTEHVSCTCAPPTRCNRREGSLTGQRGHHHCYCCSPHRVTANRPLRVDDGRLEMYDEFVKNATSIPPPCNNDPEHPLEGFGTLLNTSLDAPPCIHPYLREGVAYSSFILQVSAVAALNICGLVDASCGRACLLIG